MSLLRTREYPTKQQFESTDDFAKRMRDAIQEESTDRIQDFDILQLSNVPWTDVREYGAKGDGSTDDTIAIQAAIDASIGGQVLVPEGHYKFTALTFQKEIRFSGTVHGSSGTNGTVLESTATSGSAIALSGTASADRKRIYFENFTLIGNANLDKGFDIQGTASINPSNIGFRCVEVRTITKATGIGFYFKDASHVYMDNAIARNGTITGYGLYLDSQYFNGGPISAINCDFGNVDESVAGLYYTATSNHYNGVVFVGCYFGAGTAGGGHCIWIAHQTPTQMTFIGCGAECKNTQANGSAILIDGNTNNLAFINQSAKDANNANVIYNHTTGL